MFTDNRDGENLAARMFAEFEALEHRQLAAE